MFFNKTVLNTTKIITLTAISACMSFSVFAEQQWAEGQILVSAKPGVNQYKLDKILAKHQAKSKKKFNINSANVHLVTVPKKKEKGIITALKNNPNIDFAELDELIKPSEIHANDNYYANAWHLAKINMPTAWEKSKGAGVTVAVLDSGVYLHSDLAANVLPGYNTVSNNSETSDVNGHGTYVAGVISALSDNNKGVTSIAWNSKILPVRITNSSDGYAYFSDIAEGITWAANNGADIVNISYMANSSSTIKSAAQSFYNKGGLVVASAGNGGSDLNCSDNPYIIIVSATNNNDQKASWSDFGNCVDVSAPGTGIYTTNKSGGYSKVNGTSFSAPATAAVLALMKAHYPDLSNTELETLLESSADKTVGGNFSKQYGYGRIDAGAALSAAVVTPEVDQIAPSVSITSPEEDSSHDSTIQVQVSASDNKAVTKVELYLEGNLIASDSNSPYEFNVDTSMYSQQQVVLNAIAFDAANNQASSGMHWLNIENLAPEPEPEPEPSPVDTQAPTIQIKNLVDGSTISSNQNIVVNAADNVGVVKTELYIDGQLKVRVTTASLNYSWNVKKASSGEHQILAKAFDSAGNSKQQLITVTKSGSSKGNGKKGR